MIVLQTRERGLLASSHLAPGSLNYLRTIDSMLSECSGGKDQGALMQSLVQLHRRYTSELRKKPAIQKRAGFRYLTRLGVVGPE